MQCPACGFWKVNELFGNMKCKKCGYVNKPIEELEKERKERGLQNE